MSHQTTDKLRLSITAQQNRNVLPRCLQIFSRRGFTLTELTTETQESDQVILHCTLQGPPSWHDALPLLLHKLVDVKRVKKVEI